MIAIRDQISEKIGRVASKYNNNGNTEIIITYLTKRFISNLVWLSLLFVTANFLNLVKETIVFLLAFYPIRRSFGGYHAKSEGMCLIISVIIPLVVARIATEIHLNTIHIILVYLFAYVTAFTKGVVDNPVKRLKLEQKAAFKKQGIITLILITVIHLFFIKSIILNNVIAMAVFLGFGNLYIKNH